MEKTYKRIEYSNENLRKNINYLIQRDNTTKAALDKDFQIGEGSISRYCKADGSAIEPKISIINSLSKAFNVTMDDLINNDIEKKEIAMQEYSQRKDVLFCNKLIQQTKANLCDWRRLNFSDPEYYYEKFKSKFTFEEYDIEDLRGFITTINQNTEVFIIEHLEVIDGEYIEWDGERFPKCTYKYELYLLKSNGKVLPSCASHSSDIFGEIITCDDIYLNVLKELHRVASYYVYVGKDAYERELIYDDYLNEDLIPF